MQKRLLFKVVVGEHEYRIYVDGSIEGFDAGAVVFNYFPQIEAEILLRQRAQQEV